MGYFYEDKAIATLCRVRIIDKLCTYNVMFLVGFRDMEGEGERAVVREKC